MLLTEPVVAFFTLWIAFAWGILFLFFSSVVQTFRTNYGMNNLQTGTVQLAISVGALIGLIINPAQDMIYLRTAKRNKEAPGKPIPEARLYTSVPGSILFAGGAILVRLVEFPPCALDCTSMRRGLHGPGDLLDLHGGRQLFDRRV